MKNIAIVGAGAAGTILTLHLLNTRKVALNIFLIDDSSNVAKGIAYSPLKDNFLLNVPCSKMGVYPSQVDGFFNWLLYNGYTYKGLDFVPRKIYGDYLSDLLTTAINKSPLHKVSMVHGKVNDIHMNGHFHLVMDDYKDILADDVVLALGNNAPKELPFRSAKVYNNPWQNSFWSDLKEEDDILLLGSGLTAVDFVNQLHVQQHKGRIIMFSRNGFLPLPHEEPCMQGLLSNYFKPDDSLRTILSKVNKIKKDPFLKIIRPVCVIEELRNLFPRLWYHWSDEERRLFYQRIFPYWNIQRHRIPPEVDSIISSMKDAGKLSVISGKMNNVTEDDDRLRFVYAEGKSDVKKSLWVDKLVNCTGPDPDYTKGADSLTVKLLEKGLIKVDALQTGLVSNSRMQLKGEAAFHSNLWSIGPPLKSMFFESTAIHEIRNQSAALSEYLTS